MADIFDVGQGFRVPNYAFDPTLEIPTLDLDPLVNLAEDVGEMRKQEIDSAEDNYNKLGDIRDELTGIPVHTKEQQKRLEQLRLREGLGNDALKLSKEELQNPFKMRDLESKVVRFMNKPQVRDVIEEVLRVDNYLKDTNRIEDPHMRKLAYDDYIKYRYGEPRLDGSFVGLQDLNINQYKSLNAAKFMKDAFDQARTELRVDADLETAEGFAIFSDFTKQAADEIEIIQDQLLNNPQFMRNLAVTYGTSADDPKLQDIVKDMASTRLEERLTKSSVRNLPRSTKTTHTVEVRDYKKEFTKGIEKDAAEFAEQQGYDLSTPEARQAVRNAVNESKVDKFDDSEGVVNEEELRYKIKGLTEKQFMKNNEGLIVPFEDKIPSHFQDIENKMGPHILGTRPIDVSVKKSADLDNATAPVIQFIALMPEEFNDSRFVINSGYRTEEVNEAVGGAEMSAHLSGGALDVSTKTLVGQAFLEWLQTDAGAEYLSRFNASFINEGDHIHLSIPSLSADPTIQTTEAAVEPTPVKTKAQQGFDSLMNSSDSVIVNEVFE